MSIDSCSKLLSINLISSISKDNDIIKQQDNTITSDSHAILCKELSKYLSDFDSTASLTDAIEEIALKQEGSRFLQDLVVRLPSCSEYIFQIVSYRFYYICRFA